MIWAGVSSIVEAYFDSSKFCGRNLPILQAVLGASQCAPASLQTRPPFVTGCSSPSSVIQSSRGSSFGKSMGGQHFKYGVFESRSVSEEPKYSLTQMRISRSGCFSWVRGCNPSRKAHIGGCQPIATMELPGKVGLGWCQKRDLLSSHRWHRKAHTYC